MARALLLQRVLGFALAFGLTIFLALDGGGFDAVVRDEVGIVVWAAVAFGFATGFFPRGRLSTGCLDRAGRPGRAHRADRGGAFLDGERRGDHAGAGKGRPIPGHRHAGLPRHRSTHLARGGGWVRQRGAGDPLLRGRRQALPAPARRRCRPGLPLRPSQLSARLLERGVVLGRDGDRHRTMRQRSRSPDPASGGPGDDSGCEPVDLPDLLPFRRGGDGHGVSCRLRGEPQPVDAGAQRAGRRRECRPPRS